MPLPRPVISLMSKFRATPHNGQGILWTSVAAGDYDDWLADWATALRGVGVPFDFAFHHEPKDDRTGHHGLDCGLEPDFVAANRYVVRFLRDAGVEGMRFGPIFSKSSAIYTSMATLEPWYPGDDAVDWLGFDGYCQTFNPLQEVREPPMSFEEIIAPPLALARGMGKPLKVTETNTIPDPNDPSWKIDWLRGIPMAVRGNPELEMVMLYTGGPPSWRIDDSPEVLETFVGVARDPVFART